MAEITNNESGHKRSLHNRRLNRQVRVDLTPMVDLAFLLITFFMLTTVMNEPKAMWLNQPIGEDQAGVSDCQVLNILIDSGGRVITYEGLEIKDMQFTSFDGSNGIRQVILGKARQVKTECGNYKSGKPREIICLIKLLPGAKYKSMVDVLDEMEITSTKTYAMQEPLTEEIAEAGKQMNLLADK